MQLWAKSHTTLNEQIEAFTTGNDRQLDLLLAPFDVLGSIAHITMLQSIGLLQPQEYTALRTELIHVYRQAEKKEFTIAQGVEDVHSQVEFMLTEKLGDIGKKIHSGRSRNDQVLVDLKLYFRHHLQIVVAETEKLFELLIELSEKYKQILMPGYTHYQVAMPSSFGLWFAAYAESLADDMQALLCAFKIVNKNPLGSGAGYGSSFPLNRTLTTQLLGFDDLNYNVVYAQMTRGKTDVAVANALASVAYTLNKLADDAVHYVCQNFDFISFPEHLMEGSSIMPHKKNPDVFELIRGKTNQLKALPNTLLMLTTNMPTGYHRDWQLLKEHIMPAFDTLTDCIKLTRIMLEAITVKNHILSDKKYTYIYSVERVNQLVLEGTPFRDAYKIVGEEIQNHTFKPHIEINHTHEGSIGNLCNPQIKGMFYKIHGQFGFEKIQSALQALISD